MGLSAKSIAEEESGSLTFRYEQVRQTTTSLCSPLSAEDMQLQPMADASPAKWHLAHTTWFFETFCLGEFFNTEPVSQNYSYIFNSYYKSQGAHVPQSERGLLSRPTVQETLKYRKLIDSRMQEAFSMICPRF